MSVVDDEVIMSSDTTTVTVSHETWKRLQMRKEPGDSFDDVISRLLNKSNGSAGE